MEIKIADKSEYENFLNAQSSATLLQSWGWRDVLLSEGKEVFTYLISDGGKILASILIVKLYLFKNLFYLYSPRGPIFVDNTEAELRDDILKFLVVEIKKQFNQAIFLKIDPEDSYNVKKLGFIKSNKETQPQTTHVLDLTESIEELYLQMKKKTKYNIRIAQKFNVEVVESGDINEFFQLLEQTAQRNNFGIHKKEHYISLIKNLKPENLSLYLAKQNNIYIAGAMVGHYGGKSIYLHGASDHNYRSLMAPFYLQWHAILEAKKHGDKLYDFHGVAPQNADSSHPWYGITRFKQGFGGRYIEYMGAWDMVFKPFLYRLYAIAKKLKM